MPTIDEILELDLVSLRAHTERAGATIDPVVHRETLTRSIAVSKICSARRIGKLVAYAMLHPESGDQWFVSAFNTDPLQRTPDVLRELILSFARIVEKFRITTLKSNVYKTNQPSISFHKHLGFRITKENDKGIEFSVTLAELKRSSAVQRAERRVRA